MGGCGKANPQPLGDRLGALDCGHGSIHPAGDPCFDGKASINSKPNTVS